MQFKDVFKNGMNVDSPTFNISFNDSKGESGNSSAEIAMKVYYAVQGNNVTAQDMNNVKQIAYQALKDSGNLSLTMYNDVYTKILRLKSISARPIEGTDVWDVTCTFSDKNGTDSSIEVQLKNIQFSTQGRTSHISKSMLTVGAITYDGSEPWDFHNCIGWNDGEIAGVDVKRPNLTFQRDIWILYGNIDWTVIQSFATFTGSVNSDEFYGFAPGTVLFTGISNGQAATLKVGDVTFIYWQITLGFECSQSANIPLGSRYIGKRGWDYLWYTYQKKMAESDQGKIVVKYPVQANVEQVYPYRSFTDFFGFGYTPNFFDGEQFFNG